MKALVISDRKDIIDFVSPRLKENGFDLIHYRWIIKALDNIEEIQPDVIVLSAGEYPRHWKTLSGFVQSGIGGNNVKLYLYERTPLSEEDQKKAEELGVLSFEDAFSQAKLVEVAYNDANNLIHFCSAKYYENKSLLQLSGTFNEGSCLKYISLLDGENIYSFSGYVERLLNENEAELKVKEL